MKLLFCALCGENKDLEHHHIIPRSKGGTDAPSNLLTLCSIHHGMIHKITERPSISKLTKLALDKKINERKGTIPYGKKIASDGKTLDHCEHENRILKRISKMRSEGYTLQAIADQLNKDGIYTRRGSKWRHEYVYNLIKKAA